MRSRYRRQICASASLVVGLLSWSEAAGFCLARQCDPDAEGAVCEKDADGCSVQGVALRRSTPCVTFAVALGSAGRQLGLSDAEFNQVVTEAFALWTSVDCGGAPPGIAVKSAGAVPSAGPFSCRTVPELNVDVWHISNALPNPPVVTTATGVLAGRTKPVFTLPEGLIFDADVELNQLWLSLYDDGGTKLREILRSVAAHEAGHVLGLAHSQDPNALMFRSYDAIPGRTPTADDIRGLCALYPPQILFCPPAAVPAAAVTQGACDEAASGGGGGGCSTGGGRLRDGDGSGLFSSCLVLTGLLRQLFRRRAIRKSAVSSGGKGASRWNAIVAEVLGGAGVCRRGR